MMIQKNTTSCPLCTHGKTDLFFSDNYRTYFRCPNCLLVHVPTRYHLQESEEKALYDLHQNDPLDAGYRRFLSRLTKPLMEKLQPGSQGLDFGCGPGPALMLMLQEKGYQMSGYDPYYCNEPSLLKKKYDFICATEVVEHLRSPKEEFASLSRMLRPGGWLGIMTKMVKNKDVFGNWHYIRDLSHICFYSRPTFSFIADTFGMGLTFAADDVILLQDKK